MTDCDSCQNSGLIRKQRKELILLTNELKIQEDQINTLHSTNIKLKEEIKQREKKEFELEKKNRVLSTELKAINGNWFRFFDFSNSNIIKLIKKKL